MGSRGTNGEGAGQEVEREKDSKKDKKGRTESPGELAPPLCPQRGSHLLLPSYAASLR